MTLIGILGGLLFSHNIAHPAAAWPVFISLTLLHVYANYKGVYMCLDGWNRGSMADLIFSSTI